MLPSPVTDIKAFVPAKDPDLSKVFYTDLGFTINWSNDQIAELQISSCRFPQQKFFVARQAGNFMMGRSVDDAEVWWTCRKRSFPKSTPGSCASRPRCSLGVCAYFT
jgi:hypothetical protein